jgi:hypothetical protein
VRSTIQLRPRQVWGDPGPGGVVEIGVVGSFTCCEPVASGACYPALFPRPGTVYHYFRAWKDAGLLAELQRVLHEQLMAPVIAQMSPASQGEGLKHPLNWRANLVVVRLSGISAQSFYKKKIQLDLSENGLDRP